MADKNPAGAEWWNRVSGLAGKILGKSDEPKPDADEPQELTLEQRKAQALDVLRNLVAGGKGNAALTLYHKTVEVCEHWELPEKELLHFAELLCNEKLWNGAVPFLENYLERFEKRLIPVRLRLAKILIEQQQRPSYAARILAELPRQGLSDKEQKIRSSLEQKAQKMIDDGVLELEGRAW